MRPVRRPGELRRTLPAASAIASGATAPSGEKPVGMSTSVSSATAVSMKRLAAPVSWSVAAARTGIGLRQRAEAADDRRGGVVGERADVVAGDRELVRAAGERRVRVVDDLEDVGVLEQQRARAGALERVAERPHARRRRCRRRCRSRRCAGRRSSSRPRRRRPGRSVCGGKLPSGPAGTASTGRPTFAAGPLERAGRAARRQAGDRQRADQRLAPLGGCGGSPRGPAARARSRSARRRSPASALRRVVRVREDRLDRRREHGLAAVLADRLRDRADVALHAVAVGAVDRRAREARADAGRVDRRARDRDEDPRAVRRPGPVDHVDDVDVERADRRSRARPSSRCSACPPGPALSGMIGSPASAGAAGSERDRDRRGEQNAGTHGGASVVPIVGKRRTSARSRTETRRTATYCWRVAGAPILHVTNGDAVVPEIAAALGVAPDEILVWREILHDGPVPGRPRPRRARARARPPRHRAVVGARQRLRALGGDRAGRLPRARRPARGPPGRRRGGAVVRG